jgi:ubiquitin thioesterase protein OTUB1
MVIREEYEHGSPQVLKKLDWLQEQGWDQVWRARGDGDCFYRCESASDRTRQVELILAAFTIAYLLRILHDPNSSSAGQQALQSIEKAMPSMKSCGFDMELVSPARCNGPDRLCEVLCCSMTC